MNINVIVDGGVFSNEQREPYELFARSLSASYIYVEVNPSLEFATIFNHVAVETSKDESIELYNIKEYYYYRSKVSRPPGTLLYCPRINQTPQVMDFRY